ncbi:MULTISPECIES: hypothetical protein [unclassified Chelatococcus]|uniref:hypothetical protein n=1 Tax=Chelatococcus sp. HY11 TaxID=2835634 RepID=UPI0020C12135|nr:MULTISPECIES: hypothetical protein [unclassified Chelatococcus]MCO5076422.1 hypothetical protein [Chelatococcus sp.]
MRFGQEDKLQQVGAERHGEEDTTLLTAIRKLHHDHRGSAFQSMVLIKQLPDQGLHVVFPAFTLEQQRKETVFFVSAMQRGIDRQRTHDRRHSCYIDVLIFDRTDNAIELRSLASMLYEQDIDRIGAMVEISPRHKCAGQAFRCHDYAFALRARPRKHIPGRQSEGERASRSGHAQITIMERPKP